MIKKYSRRLINQKATLHDKEFVIYDDVEFLLNKFIEAAVAAGANGDKLMELVDE